VPGKNTGVGNTDEKQDFFEWQICDFDTSQITRVKPPNSQAGKKDIPNDKRNTRDNYGGKKRFPRLVEI
jgi:hypothetical protein